MRPYDATSEDRCSKPAPSVAVLIVRCIQFNSSSGCRTWCSRLWNSMRMLSNPGRIFQSWVALQSSGFVDQDLTLPLYLSISCATVTCISGAFNSLLLGPDSSSDDAEEYVAPALLAEREIWTTATKQLLDLELPVQCRFQGCCLRHPGILVQMRTSPYNWNRTSKAHEWYECKDQTPSPKKEKLSNWFQDSEDLWFITDNLSMVQ